MTPDEQLARTKFSVETKLKRADQALARKQFALAEAQFAWQKSQAAQSGWRLLATPTGVVLVGAAVGLLGTAVGKWADYLTTKRQQETTIILKASEVPQTLPPDAQDVQRARNLLWFVEAHYIDLPASFISQLQVASNLKPGQTLPPPVVQSQLTASAVDVIEKFEDFYPSEIVSYGMPMIGFGHVITKEEHSSGRIRVGTELIPFAGGITREQARKILQSDLFPEYKLIDELVKVPLTSQQKDALASLIYNRGPRNFRESDLLKKLNEGKYDEVPQEIARSGPVEKFPGLKRRREAEIDLWRRPPDTEQRKTGNR